MSQRHLTQKHYEAFIHAINTYPGITRQCRVVCCKVIADVCEADSVRFQRSRFENAVGVGVVSR